MAHEAQENNDRRHPARRDVLDRRFDDDFQQSGLFDEADADGQHDDRPQRREVDVILDHVGHQPVQAILADEAADHDGLFGHGIDTGNPGHFQHDR